MEMETLSTFTISQRCFGSVIMENGMISRLGKQRIASFVSRHFEFTVTINMFNQVVQANPSVSWFYMVKFRETGKNNLIWIKYSENQPKVHEFSMNLVENNLKSAVTTQNLTLI